MNLNDNDDGMVPLPPKVPEKNIIKQQQTKMDSTPISDIMSDHELMDPAQNPRGQFMMPPQSPMMMAAAPPAKSQAKESSKNPFNLTDEQMQALVAGVCAVIAFSKPIQDKLSTTIPQFLTEAGSRSTTGLIATGLIAAIVFYFAQKFLNK